MASNKLANVYPAKGLKPNARIANCVPVLQPAYGPPLQRDPHDNGRCPPECDATLRCAEMSGQLNFVIRDGDQVARLDASRWPTNARFSTYKVGIMERAGVVDRDGAGIRFNVANGYAIYRVIHECDHEISLELVEGNVLWSG